MNKLHLDPTLAMTRTGTGRRRAVAGFLAGTASVFVQGAHALGGKRRKRKKKRCEHCPQFSCCSCSTGPHNVHTKCSLISAANNTLVLEACLAICGEDDLAQVFNLVPTFSNTCTAELECIARQCPIKVERSTR